MNEKKETLIRELHERLMKKFKERIGESISSIQMPVVPIKALDSEHAAAVATVPKQEPDSPDRVNDIRNKSAAAQDLEIVNPVIQNELMEILKQGYEEFKHLLRGVVSDDNSRAELATEKFKEELMANTQKQLAEKKHAFAD